MGMVANAIMITTVGLFVGGTRILFGQSVIWLRIGRPPLDAVL